MIRQHAKKYKVTNYDVGDTVLLQNPKAKTRRGKKILNELPAFEGRILEVKGNNFKVQYETDCGEQLTNWFSVCNIVSTTKEEENKRKKSIGKTQTSKNHHHIDLTEVSAANINIDKEENQSMEALLFRLSQYNLRPEETLGDGNCFFRAISRMVYQDDRHHLEVRRQAVERLADYPEDYHHFFDKSIQTFDDYVYEMCGGGVWADNAIIRATADTLNIEIRIVQASGDHMPTFVPDEITQTVFLGFINNHYLSTTNIVEPQILRYGGVTSDDVALDHTDSIDTYLTWFYNFIGDHPEIIQFMERSNNANILSLLANYRTFRNGNSADAKRDWYSSVSSKQYH